MPTPLESANAKLQRAAETAGTLNAEIASFLEANPNPYRINGQLKSGDREYAFTLSGELVIPIRFSVLVGEVMYQLRTALDHLLAALVVGNGGTPTDRHQFPICSTPERFVDARKRGDFAGISDTAERVLEQVQPYQPTQPKPELLNLLREWNNADKHRLLVVVGGAAALGDQVTIEEVDRAFSITGMTPPFIRRITPGGTEVFAIFLGEPHATFRARAEFAPCVAIESVGELSCASVSEVVAKMVAYIGYIFEQFRECSA